MKEIEEKRQKLLDDYAKYPEKRSIIEIQLNALAIAKELYMKKHPQEKLI